MKPRHVVGRYVLAMALIWGLGGCASSDVGPNGANQNDSGDQLARPDAAGPRDADPSDIDNHADTPDNPPGLDADQIDADQIDVGQPDTTDANSRGDVADAEPDTPVVGPCSGVVCSDGKVCDPATSTCVGCVTDQDCQAGQLCDRSGAQCVECLDDDDCGPGAHCHDTYPVCVPSCCDDTTEQDAFSAPSYSHNRFDIDVSATNTPAIVYADADDDTIKYAQPVNGQWLSQEITTVSNASSIDVRMALAPDGTPHVVVTGYERFNHFWRTSAGWQSENVIDDPPSVGYCDIAVDSKGAAHIIALVGYGERIVYSYKPAQGQLTNHDVVLPAENPPVWTNLALTSDDRPIATFQIGLDKTAYVAEKVADGTWQSEIAAQNVAQVHGLGVGPDDQPIVVYRHQTDPDGVRLLTRQNQGWTDELIVDDPDHGFSPDVAVDSLGDAHVVYSSNGSGDFNNPMNYARWDGTQWQHYQLDSVGRAFYPRVVVDSDRIAHAVVYDTERDTISYLKIQ